MGRPKGWTDLEEQILLSDYFAFGAEGLMKKLNKSRYSIASKASRMGLKTEKNPVSRNTGSKHFAFCGCEGISGTYMYSIKENAKIRNLEFSVTLKYLWEVYLRQSKKCALTGLPIQFSSKSNSFDGTASLDRIDSSRGYVQDNVQWIHKDVNQMKWNFDQCNFIHYCRLIVKNAEPKPLPFIGSWTREAAGEVVIFTVYGK